MSSNNTNNSKEENFNSSGKNETNEQGNISIQGGVKIFDPETKEVFVNVRT